MPRPLEMDKLAREPAARQADNEPSPPAAGDEWWDAVLSDPRAAGKPPVPISSRRLDESLAISSVSSACGASAPSKSSVRTRSVSTGRMRCGRTSARVCSTTAASTAQGVMKRPGVGRISGRKEINLIY